MNSKVFLSFLVFSLQLKCGAFVFKDSTERKSILFFRYYEVAGGVSMNQGSIGYKYFEVNYRPNYTLALNLISYKNFELNFYTNYIKKSMIGSLDNYAKTYFFYKRITSSQNLPLPKYNLDFFYYAFDIKPKLVLFMKKKFQISLGAGIRGNFLAKYNYNDTVRSYEIDNFVIPNLKKKYINYVYSLAFSYAFKKLGSSVFVEAEVNNDRDYITVWKYGLSPNYPVVFQELYGAKFQCLFFRIGFRQYL